MKKSILIPLAFVSTTLFAQMDVSTTRLTHILPAPNQALFNPQIALPGGTKVFISTYHNDYYKVRYSNQDYYIFYPYFDEIQYAVDLRDEIETGGVNISGTKELPKQPKVRYTSSPGSRTIHTGPRGGRYYINKNGNKTYIKQ